MALLDTYFTAPRFTSQGVYCLFDMYNVKPRHNGQSVDVLDKHGRALVSIDFKEGVLIMSRKPNAYDIEAVTALCDWAFEFGGYKFYTPKGATLKELLSNFEVFDIGTLEDGSKILFPSYLSNPFAD